MSKVRWTLSTLDTFTDIYRVFNISRFSTNTATWSIFFMIIIKWTFGTSNSITTANWFINDIFSTDTTTRSIFFMSKIRWAWRIGTLNHATWVLIRFRFTNRHFSTNTTTWSIIFMCKVSRTLHAWNSITSSNRFINNPFSTDTTTSFISFMGKVSRTFSTLNIGTVTSRMIFFNDSF
jgi:hypothetical protein